MRAIIGSFPASFMRWREIAGRFSSWTDFDRRNCAKIADMKQQRDWEQLEADLSRRFDVINDTALVAGREYRILRPRSADDLIDEEAFEHDERLPYWAEIWPSAVLLASRVAELSGNGRRCIELGAGCGLPSLVAAAVGFEVTVSDYYPECLEFIELNAWHNQLTGVHTRMVDWREFPADLKSFDLVIGGDVLYEAQYPKLLAASVAQTLKPEGEAIITDPSRSTARTFEQECRQIGLLVQREAPMAAEHGQVRHVVDTYRIRHS